MKFRHRRSEKGSPLFGPSFFQPFPSIFFRFLPFLRFASTPENGALTTVISFQRLPYCKSLTIFTLNNIFISLYLSGVEEEQILRHGTFRLPSNFFLSLNPRRTNRDFSGFLSHHHFPAFSAVVSTSCHHRHHFLLLGLFAESKTSFVTSCFALNFFLLLLTSFKLYSIIFIRIGKKN